LKGDRGRVSLDGRDVARIRRSMAYLPQRSEIDWDYPAVVREVVLMGRYPHRPLGRRPTRGDRAIVAQALERVGLEAFADRQIGELSGGQQQRAFLARALAQQATVLLLDEPLAGIDALTQNLIEEQVRALRDEGALVCVVNHDLATVGRLYDKILVLSRRLVAYGTPEEAFTPKTIAQAYGGIPAVLET
jgi:manganese transport system ATP-binding protein